MFSVSFHVSILSSNGPLNALKLIACVVVMCWSSKAMYSSMPLKTEVPVSLYGSICKTTGSQPASMASKEVSMENSLPATSDCFWMRSTFSSSLRSKTVDKVQESSGWTFLPDF